MKLLLIIVILLIAAGIIVLVAKPQHTSQKVYAQADGHKIYKRDVDNLIGSTQEVSEHDGATVLANKYLYEAMAKKAGITVSDSDVTAQFGAAVVSQKNTNRYVYQSDLNSVYFDKLSAYNKGLYQGKLIAANFSRYIAFQSSLLAERQAINPLIGNQAAIDQDKAAARNFIKDLYNQIKAHKITFDQAIQMEHDNPQVGLTAYPTLPHSGPFDTSNVLLGGTQLVESQSIQPTLAAMKAGEISKPFPVSVSNSSTKKDQMVQSYYLVVEMDSTKGSHSGLTFDKYLSQSKQKLGYKVYV